MFTILLGYAYIICLGVFKQVGTMSVIKTLCYNPSRIIMKNKMKRLMLRWYRMIYLLNILKKKKKKSSKLFPIIPVLLKNKKNGCPLSSYYCGNNMNILKHMVLKFYWCVLGFRLKRFKKKYNINLFIY